LKVCLITFEYPPFFIGGGGVYAHKISKALVELGVEMHVITHSNCLKSLTEEEGGLVIYRVPIVHRPLTSFASFSISLLQAYKYISKKVGGFDVIHGNGVDDFVLGRKLASSPRVVTIHHLVSSLTKGRSLLFRVRNLSGELGMTPMLEGRVIERADRIIAVSEFTRRALLAKFSKTTSKVEVIQNGIDLDGFNIPYAECESVRESLKLHDSFVYLWVGRVDDERKDLSLLLHAFRLLNGEIPNTKLLIAGLGNQGRAWALAQSLGISKDVLILGFVPDAFLRKLYCACNVFVSTSTLEGFGMTIVEGMAAGKPILAPKVGGIPEIVRDGVNGRLFVERDPLVVSKMMRFYYDNRDLADNVGRVNKQYVKEEFSWAKAASRTLRVYSEACDRVE
jgi:1,4-alpha-glucan branching enzyme